MFTIEHTTNTKRRAAARTGEGTLPPSQKYILTHVREYTSLVIVLPL